MQTVQQNFRKSISIYSVRSQICSGSGLTKPNSWIVITLFRLICRGVPSRWGEGCGNPPSLPLSPSPMLLQRYQLLKNTGKFFNPIVETEMYRLKWVNILYKLP